MIQTIGHRGAAALEPENTLRGFRKAIEIGVNYVEFDVHRCKSGELVVIHDETVDRTTNGEGFVADLTLLQLKKLDAGKGEKIPTLQEVIDVCKGKMKMCIELKSKGLEEDTVAAIERNRIAADVVVISFYHDFIKKVKGIAKTRKLQIKTGALIVGNPVNAADVVKAAKADYLSANQNFVDEKMVRDLRKAGLGITVWNCDTERDIRRLAKLGVDAIGSNRPDLLLRVMERNG
ncbi:glycerophosphodiester phosphodiesterase [Candidatus Woesearchaeota archaeon]|nr:glycerophosphodiester phosphodiesterase [Candidatus Woesearchaeota archaeon]